MPLSGVLARYTVFSNRHRGSLGDYPTEGEGLDEKRASNPPPIKSPRDPPEGMAVLFPDHVMRVWSPLSPGMKSVGIKVVRPLPPGTIGSGESDIESGEEGKRRKAYRGDHDATTRRSLHINNIMLACSSSSVEGKIGLVCLLKKDWSHAMVCQ